MARNMKEACSPDGRVTIRYTRRGYGELELWIGDLEITRTEERTGYEAGALRHLIHEILPMKDAQIQALACWLSRGNLDGVLAHQRTVDQGACERMIAHHAEEAKEYRGRLATIDRRHDQVRLGRLLEVIEARGITWAEERLIGRVSYGP